MNKTYKVVWNESLGTWCAISEVSKSRGKRSSSKAVVASAFLAVSAFTFSGLSMAADNYVSINDGGAQSGNYNNDGAVANNSVAIGPDSKSIGESGVAIGNNANVSGLQGVAIGNNAQAGYQSMALGHDAVATAFNSMALGGNSIAYTDGTALGQGTYANKLATAMGNGSLAVGLESTAYGYSALAGTDSFSQPTAGTDPDSIGKAYATAMGSRAKASAQGSTALGASSLTEVENGVALGANSVANTVAGIAGYVPTSADQSQINAINATQSTLGAVSVGSTGNTRQITNVAAGTVDTDAVNVAQLKAVQPATETHYVSVNDGGVQSSNYNNDGAKGLNSLAIGVGAEANGDNAIAIGTGSQALKSGVVAMGLNAVADYTPNGYVLNSVAVGTNVTANGRDTVAIGLSSRATGEAAVAIGVGNSSLDSFTVTMGTNNSITGGTYNAAMGLANNVKGFQNAVVGYGNNFDGYSSTVMGTGNVVSGPYTSVFGLNNNVAGQTNSVLGGSNTINGNSNAVSGQVNEVYGTNNVVTGLGNKSLGSGYSILLGRENAVTGGFATAAGFGNKINTDSSNAFGLINQVDGNESSALGNYNIVANNNTHVLGNKVTTTQNNSVILGNESSDREATSVDKVTINGEDYTVAGVGSAANGVVSVGKVGGERQIINVAAGEVSATSTDAVNGSQLFATNQAIADSQTHYVSMNDGGIQANNYNNDGAQGKNSLVVGMNSRTTVDGTNNVSVGLGNYSQADNVIAIGSGNYIDTATAVALGINNNVQLFGGTTAVGIGNLSYGAQNAIVGNNNKTIGSFHQLFGTNNNVTSGSYQNILGYGNSIGGADYNIAVGTNNNIATSYFPWGDGGRSLVVGQSNNVDGIRSGIFGQDTVVKGNGSFSFGGTNKITNHESTALGLSNDISGERVYVLGTSNTVSGGNSSVLGSSNTVAQSNTFVIGNKVTTTQANSVVLGNESTDREATSVDKVTINGEDYTVAGVGSAANGVVSVGKVGGERQIINVAAGEVSATSTDAVNGSQLFATNQAIEDNKTHYVSVNDAGTQGGNYNNDGAIGKNSVAIGVGASANSENTIALGANNNVTGKDALALGSNNTVKDFSAIAIGNSNSLNNFASTSIALGTENNITGPDALAIGSNNTAKGQSSIAIGASNNAGAVQAITVGQRNKVQAEGSSAFGVLNTINSGATTALGSNNDIQAYGSLGTGYANTISGTTNYSSEYSSAIGAFNKITDSTQSLSTGFNNSITGGEKNNAVGANNTITNAKNSTVLGNANKVEQDNTQVLGNNVITTQANSVVLGNESTDRAATSEDKMTINGQDYLVAGVGSVANGVVSVGKVGGERQIINLAAGEVSANSTDAINGSQLYATNQAITEVGKSTVAAKSEVVQGDNMVVTETKGVNGQSIYNVATAKEVNFDKTTVGTVVTDSATGKITGLTAGEVSATSTDAINGSQLYATNKAIADSQTHYVSVNDGGTKGDNYNNDGASGVNSTAIGVNTVAVGDRSTAIGYGSRAGMEDSIAIGSGNMAFGPRNIAIGFENQTGSGNPDNIVLGISNQVHSNNSTVMGRNNLLIGNDDNNVFGSDNEIQSPSSQPGNNTVLGNKNKISSSSEVSDTALLGNNITATQANSVVLGNESTDRAATSVDKMTINGQDYLIAGVGSAANGVVSVGKAGGERQIINVATGEVSANSTDAINGSQLYATNQAITKSIADSQTHYVSVNDDGTKGDNYNNDGATGKNAVAMGVGASAAGENVIAIGNNNKVDQNNTSVLGSNVITTQANSVVLGNESTDRAATSESKVTILGQDYVFAGVGSAANGVVSVGKVGGERQIINVAAGQLSETSTDAVNGSQLYATNQAISSLQGQVAGSKSTVTEGKNTTVTQTTNADGSTDYQVATKDDVSFDSVTVGGIKADAQTNKITGLADGDVSTTSNEAVNGSQLHSTAESVAGALGGNATVNADGTISTSNIGNTGKDNVHDAIASIQGQVAGSKTSVSAGKNTVVSSSTNTDGSNNYQVALADDIKLNSVTANQVNVGTVSINSTTNKVSGLANATISQDSTDAVNGSQLHQTNSHVSQYLGGGSALNPDGTIAAPTYNVAGGTYHNVGDALGAVDARVTNLEQAFYNTNKNIDDLRNDTYAGIAGAMAVGNLPQPTEAGMSMMSAGLSGYRGETAVAVGISAITDSNKIVWKMGASADSRSNIGGAVSVGYQWK
jgi:trimeric autotransporter adhesin